MLKSHFPLLNLWHLRKKVELGPKKWEMRLKQEFSSLKYPPQFLAHDFQCLLNPPPELDAIVNNVCGMVPDAGPCIATFNSQHEVKFFFNPVTRECKTFLYGGCAGNKNRFDNKGDCMNMCKHAEITWEQSNNFFRRYYHGKVENAIPL